MNLNNFLEGVNILRPYYNDPNGYHLGADHDIIYLYTTDKPLSPEAVQKMLDLGWFQESSPEEYNPEEGWAAFV